MRLFLPHWRGLFPTEYLRLFHDIPAADEARLTTALEVRALPENAVLLRAGQVSQELFFIASSVLRIVGAHEDGTETPSFFLKDNQLCPTFDSLTDQGPATERIQAACATEVLVLPRPALLRLGAQLPYLQSLIDFIAQRTLLENIQLRHRYQGASAVGRYQTLLLRQPEVALRVSLRDVASYLGITPKLLSRIRRRLAA